MPDGSNLATSDDVFAGVDWDSVTAQLKQMGPPPRPPPFVGESDTVLLNQKSLDPVFNKDVDLAAPTEEDMKIFHLAPAWNYPEGAEIRPVDIICVGAGMAGIYVSALAQWRLKNFNLRIYERNPKAVGTWYPGVRCDVPSHGYVFRFEPNPDWSSEYVDADEIEKYFDFMVKKYFIPDSATFNAPVREIIWHEDQSKWEVIVDITDPATGKITEKHDFADFVINGSGILHSPNIPTWPGQETFKGRIMHSARYDRSVELKGKVVSVIGNGSSGIGIIGTISDEVEKLVAYQRKNTWIVAQLGQTDPTKLSVQKFSEDIRAKWHDRKTWYDFYKNAWLTADTFYPMFLKNSQMSLFATAQARILMEKLIPDPELRSHFTPSYPVGCRRVTPHEGYFKALLDPKNELVKIQDNPIVRITETGIVTADGVERYTDHIILATGFHVTYRPNFKVTGRDGRVLQEDWAEYPEAYKAVMVSGYPNYFSVYGPIAPVASNSIHMMEEQQISWHVQAIGHCQSAGVKSMEPLSFVQREWNDKIAEKLKDTIWNIDCGGWYRHKSGRIISHYPGPSHEFMDEIASPKWDEFDLRK